MKVSSHFTFWLIYRCVDLPAHIQLQATSVPETGWKIRSSKKLFPVQGIEPRFSSP